MLRGKEIPRRRLVKDAAKLAGAGLLLTRSRLGSAHETAPLGGTGKLTVVAVGAHPDDPETGCGGTLAKFAAEGHRVIIVYLTRGEGWDLVIKRVGTPQAAAALRSRQAEDACKILGAQAVFANQIDGATELTNSRYQESRELLAAQNPHVVLTHWPVDTHRDHRVAAMLAYDFFWTHRRKLPLYFYEVVTGNQTQHFVPTDYVDITETEPKKKAAVYLHESQRIENVYEVHVEMQRFRGNECGCRHAEAFVHCAHSPSSPLFLRKGRP